MPIKSNNEVLDVTSIKIIHGNQSTRPPKIKEFVGRKGELRSLLESSCSVISINGLGGFGKSSLAAQYVVDLESRKEIEFSWWADCKEEGNNLQTNIIKILQHITQGEVAAASLQKINSKDLIALLFEKIENHRIALVFDNIDHYIDLETQKGTAQLNELIEFAIGTTHKARVVLTSRPIINYTSSRFLQVNVPGLTLSEIDELFRVQGAANSWDSQQKSKQLENLHRLTQGSALHLSLIATQIAKQRLKLDELLTKIEGDPGLEVQNAILSEVWISLKPEGQKVLRYLAELPYPEADQQIARCFLGGICRLIRFSSHLKP